MDSMLDVEPLSVHGRFVSIVPFLPNEYRWTAARLWYPFGPIVTQVNVSICISESNSQGKASFPK